MLLQLLCCCCGVEMAKMTVPWDASLARPEPWWTREPCTPCREKLAAEDRMITDERTAK